VLHVALFNLRSGRKLRRLPCPTPHA
jgi:hypothetical protein